jgi:hypothetical protein
MMLAWRLWSDAVTGGVSAPKPNDRRMCRNHTETMERMKFASGTFSHLWLKQIGWSLVLMEGHRLKVFENRVLRRILAPKRDEVTGGWRKLRNKEPHNWYSLFIHSWITLQPFVGPWPLLRFHNIFYTVSSTPWMSDQPVTRPLSTHRATQTQNNIFLVVSFLMAFQPKSHMLSPSPCVLHALPISSSLTW